jgi:RNA polymerase sigma-70 factor (ECF subfamily)
MARLMTSWATHTQTHPALASALGLHAPTRTRRAARPSTTRELFEAHAGFVLRVVRRLGAHPSDAEDVTQEVFVIVHRRLSDLRDDVPVRSWLFGIARRVVANHLRKTQRRREHGDAVGIASTLEGPAEQLQLARDRARLEHALARLDDDKRAVFVLFELEGCDMREVAEMLGCPLNTAYSRLYAARELVRRYVLGARPGASR